MKHLLKLLWIAIVTMSLLNSCSTRKIAYTSSFQKKYDLKESQLRTIQFYTSGELVLIQDDTISKFNALKGKALTKDSITIDKIIIPKNTFGVVERLSDDRLIVSFESGDNRQLAFGPGEFGKYFIQAKIWDGNIGKLMYDGKQYKITSGKVYLKIKTKSVRSIKKSKRKLKGIKIV